MKNKYHKIRPPEKDMWIYKNKKYTFKDGRQGFTRDEHRYIMERYLGRKLKRNEVVDHINRNKNDNRIKNLRVMSLSEHTTLHQKLGEIHKFSRADSKMGNYLSVLKQKKFPIGGKYWCNYCKAYLHKNQFSKNKCFWTGLQKQCKKCMRILYKKSTLKKKKSLV